MANECANPPNQIIMLCVGNFWQGEGLSNMPTFRIRMAITVFATVSRHRLGTQLAMPLNVRDFPPRFTHNG
jgi:hypothetical protein